MYIFLNFMFAPETLADLEDVWTKIYDLDFIRDTLCANLDSFRPAVQPVLATLEAKVATAKEKDDTKSNTKTKPSTVPEPFNMTRPKARLMAEPERVDNDFKAAGPGYKKGLYAKTVPIDRKINASKEANKEKLKEVTADRASAAFNLHEATTRASDRPDESTTDFLYRINVDREFTQEEVIWFKETKARGGLAGPRPDGAKPCPVADANALYKALINGPKRDRKAAPQYPPVAVKLTNAALLREDAFYRKKQEAEAKVLQQYASELRDSSEFDAWQNKMKEKDESEKMAGIEKRRVEMMMSQEEAAEAKLKQLVHNKESADELRLRLHTELENEKVARAEERLRNVELVQTVQDEGREALRIAHEAETRKRQQMHDARMQDREDNTRLLKEERATEMARREDVIRQIRALAEVKRADVKEFDKTTTAGHGIGAEMSLLELEERLKLMKETVAREEERRRAEIQADKEDKAAEFAAKAALLQEYRKMGLAEGQKKREDAVASRQRLNNKQAEIRLQGAIELDKRLKEKAEIRRKLEEKLSGDERDAKLKAQFMGAEAGQREQKRFTDLTHGQEREQLVRQRERLKTSRV